VHCYMDELEAGMMRGRVKVVGACNFLGSTQKSCIHPEKELSCRVMVTALRPNKQNSFPPSLLLSFSLSRPLSSFLSLPLSLPLS
jgi:Fe-S-cluster containining protein